MLIRSIHDLTVEMLDASERNLHVCQKCGEYRSVKYKFTNQYNGMVKYYCSMCYLHLMMDIECANRLVADRFFDIPEFIYYGDTTFDPEDKIPVYHAGKIGEDWHIIYPTPHHDDITEKVYLVTGDLLEDFGEHEGPVINHMKILEDITEYVVYHDMK